MQIKLSKIVNWLNIDFNIKEDAMVTGICIDSRKVKPGDLFIPLVGANVDGHKYISKAFELGAVATLCSDLSYFTNDNNILMVEDVLGSLQSLASSYREYLALTIIAITGSNGKTSTKDLIDGMLSTTAKTQKTFGNLNNEIGVPLTILSFDIDTKFGIVEMGMENLDEIRLLSDIAKPDYALITNVGSAHLENLKTVANIAKAKLEIISGLTNKSMLFINGDDKNLVDEANSQGLTYYTYGESSSNDYYFSNYQQNDNSISFDTNIYPTITIDVLGKHQAYNALGALAVCNNIGIDFDKLTQGLNAIELTKNRSELSYIDTTLIFNDVYKSNPESLLATLAVFKDIQKANKIVVLGDMLDLGPTTNEIHYQIGEQLVDFGVNKAYCYGPLASYIAEGANSKGINAIAYDDKQALALDLFNEFSANTAIMLKGSRSMKMEDIINYLKEQNNAKN